MRFAHGAAIFAVILALHCPSAFAAGTLTVQGGARQPISIRDHRVGVTIDDGFARVEIVQTFHNPNDADVEALYSSPLPRQAALSEVEITSGERTIRGEVVAKETARAVYEEERDRGNDAGLATKNEYKTFEFSVARVPARSDTAIRIVYYQPIEIDTGVGRFVYPLRDGGVEDAAAASFWSANAKVEGEIAFDIELRSSAPVEAVRIAGFESEAKVERLGEGHYRVRLSRPRGKLTRDLVFYYRLRDDLPGRLDLVPYRSDPSKPGSFLLVLTPGIDLPPLENGADFTFLLDVSGSMKTKLRALAEGVKQALRRMRPGDRFRIVTFNGSARDVTGGYVAVSDESVRRGIDLVLSLESSGSTNLFDGVHLALRGLDDDRVTSLVLVTDGVANAGELSPKEFDALVSRFDVRIFGFVMGNSANWPLLELLAESSGGFATGVSVDDDIVGQIRLAQSKITHECLHDAELRIRGVETFDASDDLLGKVFRGQQVVFFGRYEKGGEATVELLARISGEDRTYETKIRFPEIDARYPEIERLWALNRVRQLSALERRGLLPAEESRPAIRDLGIAHQIVTDETSMLVLSDEDFARHGVERRNEGRVASERRAQAVRMASAPEEKRADAADPMFDRPAPHVGRGAFDWTSAALSILLSAMAILGLRLRRTPLPS